MISTTIRPKGAEGGMGWLPMRPGRCPSLDVWDAMCRTIMSAGSRRGAMMATLRCDHPDIEAFISAKSDAARLRMFKCLRAGDRCVHGGGGGRPAQWDLKLRRKGLSKPGARDL